VTLSLLSKGPTNNDLHEECGMKIINYRTDFFYWANSCSSFYVAVVWWLIAWSQPENAEENILMHKSGKKLLHTLLGKHVGLVEFRKIEIQRRHNFDAVVLDDEYVLCFLDKAHTVSLGAQLSSYRETLAEHYPNCRLLPTFLDIEFVAEADQLCYESEVEQGCQLFSRLDFLLLLQSLHDVGVNNALLYDFKVFIERLDPYFRNTIDWCRCRHPSQRRPENQNDTAGLDTAEWERIFENFKKHCSS
jgi:hypothetical protein